MSHHMHQHHLHHQQQQSANAVAQKHGPSSTSSSANSKSMLLGDNNNILCGTPNVNTPSAAAMAAAGAMSAQPHPPLRPGYLYALPFQFQERGHFRFGDDLQLPPGASMAGRLGESLIPKSDPMEAKLQEMLRYNMDKYANQPLDISRRIRELLSVHNIGQRLFAKYILGLSQGNVSELLSKPKPWDKLTEKGRDSYRKMQAWGCDDSAVMLLKNGRFRVLASQDAYTPSYSRRQS
ncbi:homeobox protein cut-like [Eurosta solidaginis]|uniref:homeobox protein cut-like n=1 Tax=Eurosta solidaginis TaxID=178769 RepID=UPI003530F25B